MLRFLRPATLVTALFAATPGGPAFLTAQAATPWPLWSDLSPGPYAIGFAARFTRSAWPNGAREASRPLRVFVWYPARGDTGDAMSFGAYLDAVDPPDGFEAYHGALLERDRGSLPGQFSGDGVDASVEALLSSPVPARLQAEPADGRYPLVIHLLGNGSHQLESTVLWEYLASHGYVVGVVPQFGTDLESMGVPYSAEGAALQRHDANVARRLLSELPFAGDRWAAMGHSFGGIGALLLTADDPAPDAVVLLDGSPNIPRGRDVLVGIESWDRVGTETPILNAYTTASGERDLALLLSMRRAIRHHVMFRHATHFDFQNWPLYSLVSGVPDARGVRRRSDAEGHRIHHATAEIVRAFLDHYLRGDVGALGRVTGEIPVGGSVNEIAEFFTDGPG